ncbi:MAG: hypothetical protein ACP5PB_10740, partial [Acidimicrobiales bacterium]
PSIASSRTLGSTMTPRDRRLDFGDWVIVIGLIVAAVLMVATLGVTLVLQFANRQLIQDNHVLTVQNHQVLANSNRNHRDSLALQADLRALCVAAHVVCAVPR